MKRIICMVICLLMAAAVFAACSQRGGKATDDSVGASQSVENSAGNRSAVNGNDSLLAVETFSIDTPYCEIKYPSIWEDNISFKQLTDNGYTLCFYTKLGGNSIRVFDLSFNSGQGALLGTIENDNQDKLWMTVYDADSSKLSQDQQQIISEMCDDINVTIANLEKDYGFIRK